MTPRGAGLRTLLLQEEKTVLAALEKIAGVVALHLRRQKEAGAAVLQIFDTMAGELSPHHYEKFALGPLRRVLDELGDLDSPIIVFARGRNHVEFKERIPEAVLSVDWTVDLETIPDRENIGVQGNLDPAVLAAGAEITQRETERMLDRAKGLAGHIANLGHGVLPSTPVESVQEFVSTVKLYSVIRK